MKAFTACGVAAVLCWAALAGALAADEVAVAQRFSGEYGGIEEAARRAVRDAQAWAKLWAELQKIVEPVPALPEVDFERQMVLAVFLGQRSSGGHSVRIESVKRDGDELAVSVSVRSPPPGGMVTMALTQPYDIVVVERFDGPVRFEEQAAAAQPPLPGRQRPAPPAQRP
jgi:hypothetical protein